MATTTHRRSLKDDIGYVVGIAMLVVIFINAGTGAVITSVVDSGVKANRQDYLEFSTLYVGTFILSMTLTLAVVIFAVPRIYGYNVSWAIPLLVLLTGSVCTGVSVPVPPVKAEDLGYDPRRGVLYLLALALLTFSKYYGLAFLGGAIVGVTGGLVLVAIAHHRRLAGTPDRRKRYRLRPAPAQGRRRPKNLSGRDRQLLSPT